MKTKITDNRQVAVGLLIDADEVSKYELEFIEWCRSCSSVKLCALIFVSREHQQGLARGLDFSSLGSNYDKVKAILANRIFRREKYVLSKISRHQDHLETDKFPVSKITDSEGPVIISINENSEKLGSVDLRDLLAADLDLIVDFTHSQVAEFFDRISRNGIVFLMQGNHPLKPGSIAGFWDCLNRRDESSFCLIRQRSGSRDVIFEGHLQTQTSYLLNQARLCERGFYYLKSQILSISLQTRPLKPTNDKVGDKDVPGLSTLFFYLFLQLGLRLKRLVIFVLLKKKRRWSVAFAKAKWSANDGEKAIRIPVEKNHFLADPFVFEDDLKTFCFVEDFDYAKGLGCISAYELLETEVKKVGVVLEEPFHLSFPYVFRYKNDIYMCPESIAKNQIRLYKAIRFPSEWKLDQVLMNDVVAADTVLFENNGKWWMLTNIDPLHEGDCCNELYAFFADSPRSTEWTPHSANPLVVDSRCGRNGGLISDDDKIYRIAQRQGYDLYGKDISIRSIEYIDENDFEEAMLYPHAKWRFGSEQANHHMHSNGVYTVFDFMEIRKPSTKIN